MLGQVRGSGDGEVQNEFMPRTNGLSIKHVDRIKMAVDLDHLGSHPGASTAKSGFSTNSPLRGIRNYADGVLNTEEGRSHRPEGECNVPPSVRMNTSWIYIAWIHMVSQLPYHSVLILPRFRSLQRWKEYHTIAHITGRFATTVTCPLIIRLEEKCQCILV